MHKRALIAFALIALIARVAVTNLGEARWLSSGTGAVTLIAEGNGKLTKKLTVPVDHLDSAVIDDVKLTAGPVASPTVVTITFQVLSRMQFGEKFTVRLEP